MPSYPSQNGCLKKYEKSVSASEDIEKKECFTLLEGSKVRKATIETGTKVSQETFNYCMILLTITPWCTSEGIQESILYQCLHSHVYCGHGSQ